MYIELDSEQYAVRQLIIDDHSKIHLSCREDCLAEGIVFLSDLDGETYYISEKVFEEKWSMALFPYKAEWLQTKKKYCVGSKVEGVSLFFYPQGVVVKGKDFYAIYESNKISQINQKIEAYVKSFDDKNMWLVLT